jgi:hypothetical protein
MKLRIVAATFALALATTACKRENPVAPESPPPAPRMEAGNWMGSGH